MAPGSVGAQHRWIGLVPLPGSGRPQPPLRPPFHRRLRRACARDADIRLYGAHANAKYSGVTNYEQPMHIDRNHSWLPAGTEAPWWNLQSFLYLCDVGETDNPTRLVSVRDSTHVRAWMPVVMPDKDPALYSAEQRASGGGARTSSTGPTCSTGGPVHLGALRPLPPRACLQACRAGLDRVRPGTVELDRSGVDAVRRALDPTGAGALRVPTARPSDLGRGPAPGVAIRYPGLDLEPWRCALADHEGSG